jgi:hypothetical protein
MTVVPSTPVDFLESNIEATTLAVHRFMYSVRRSVMGIKCLV